MSFPMPALDCKRTRSQFSAYLDGAVSGAMMQALAAHLESCADCANEFAQWRSMQSALAGVGPAKMPKDLALRLRHALLQEFAPGRITWQDRMALAWRNTFAPLALQVSAGAASACIMLGTVILLLGVASAPEQAIASDEPTGAATAPHFLYASSGSDTQPILSDDANQPIVVQAEISASGYVYDYRIVSGSVSGDVRDILANRMLFSRFAPATLFGQPTRGRVLLSYSDLTVHG